MAIPRESRQNNAIQVRRVGGTEALEWRPVEVGELTENEVLIRHAAVGVNYIDVYHRTGLYPLPLPLIPGVEGAGVVVDVGAGVVDLEPGDRVAYGGVVGSYQELRRLPADRVLKIPESISFDLAAAMMLQGMTAQVLLTQVHKVKRGETVLVHAAAGGTGLILCQWASALGATVIGTVSSREKAEIARRNGCTHPIIHGQEDFVERVNEITSGRKLPVVYDSIGRDTFLRSLDCLAPRGLMVSFGQASGAVPPFDPTVLAQKGSLYLTRPSVFTFIKEREQLQSVFDDVLKMVSSGAVTIQVNHRYPLRDAAQAHRDLEARRTTGPVILIP
jgi:NADPH2:quinone reductase